MPEVAYFKPDFGGAAGFAHKVYTEILRQGLPPRSAALLTAHMALSTGWGRGAHNYILAGVKAGGRGVCYGEPGPTYPYVCLCTFEYVGGKLASGCADCASLMARDGKPRCKHPFKAYASLAEGVAGVLRTLRASRYESAYRLLMAGSTAYFAEVGRAGWYTAPISTTSASMKKKLALVYKYLKLPPPSGGIGSVFLWTGMGYLLFKYAVPRFF
jgi:hypothetical protein